MAAVSEFDRAAPAMELKIRGANSFRPRKESDEALIPAMILADPHSANPPRCRAMPHSVDFPHIDMHPDEGGVQLPIGTHEPKNSAMLHSYRSLRSHLCSHLKPSARDVEPSLPLLRECAAARQIAQLLMEGRPHAGHGVSGASSPITAYKTVVFKIQQSAAP